MKLLLIFILYIQYSLSQLITKDSSKKIVQQYPKKVWPTSRHYHFNNGKYFYPTHNHQASKKKRESELKSYTVFAKPYPESEVEINHQIVPDSPYFQVGKQEMPQRRSRVKKVLPEYTFARKKRSADEKDEVSKLQAPVKKSSKSVGSVKRFKTSVRQSGNNKSRVKKLWTSVKLSNENEVEGKQSNAAKKQSKISRTGKKKSDLSKRTLSQPKNKKQKILVPQNQQLNQKILQPAVGRSKTLKSNDNKRTSNLNQKLKPKISPPAVGRSKRLKSNDNKKISHLGSAQRTLKASQQKKRAQTLRNSNTKLQKKLSRTHLNSTSKNRAVQRQDQNARRLIAGTDALIEDYPYTVSIQRDKFHWCTGAILNPRLIITTANCLWRGKSISKMRVRAGSRHTSHGGQVAKIQEIMKHPGWKLRKNPDNDVALALLDRNIRFSHGLHAVDLPNRAMMPPFDDVWITSWGSERRDGIFETRGMTLQVYQARVMDRRKCNNVTQRFGVSVTENFICLAQTGRRAPCTRDTGAPAVSDGVLWGLASWGIRKLCGTERFPAMFSYLASQQNMDFIVNATHYLMSEERIYPFPDRYPERKFPLTSTTTVLPY